MINRGELEGRFDSTFYTGILTKLLKSSKYDIKSIKEVCQYIKTGFASGQKDQAKQDEGIIQIRPTNLDENGLLKFDKNIYLPYDLKEKKKNDFLVKGEILFNNTNSQEWVGKTAYFDLDGEYFCSNHITRIFPNENIKAKYLWILLNVYHKYNVFYNSCTNWNNQSGINNELLKSYKIPIPSQAIQQKIIDIIDNAYKQKKQKEEEAKNILDGIDNYLLNELGIVLPQEPENTLEKRTFQVEFKNVFNNRFDPAMHSATFTLYTNRFNMIPLNQVVYIDPQTVLPLSNEKVTFLPMEKISDTYGVADVSLSRMSSNSKGYTKFKNGDLLWSKITPCMENGKSAVVENLYNGYGFGSTEYYVFRSRSNKKININYIYFLFRLKSFRENAKLFFTGSSGHLRVDKAYFNTLDIPLPSRKVQDAIVNELIKKRSKAIRLEKEAIEVVKNAKKEVEKIILGDSYES